MGVSTGGGRTLRLVVALFALGAAAQAGAAMPGLYFNGFYMDSSLAYSSANVGEARAEAWRAEIWGSGYDADVTTIEESKFDRTDVGYSFGVGFQFSDYLAAELAYVQMGEVLYAAIGNVERRSDSRSFRTSTRLRSRARGLGLTGIAIYPMGDHFALDARGGVLLGKKKVGYTIEVQAGGYDRHSLKDGSVAYTLGAGINWSMAPGTAIRLGYTRLQKALYDGRGASSWVLGLKYAW